MKLTETLHFSKKKYRQELHDKNLSHIELARTIYRKRVKRLSSKVSAGAGVAAAVVTGGHSLVASAVSGRNISVESQKIQILEEEWARRGQPPLPQSTLRDKVIPITVAIGSTIFAFGVDVALAGASPDQFFQLTDNPALNEFLIGNVYYTGVKAGVSKVGKMVVKKTVSRAPKSAYDADQRGSSQYSDCKSSYSDDEDDSDGKYSNGEEEDEEEDEEEEEEDDDDDDEPDDDEDSDDNEESDEDDESNANEESDEDEESNANEVSDNSEESDGDEESDDSYNKNSRRR